MFKAVESYQKEFGGLFSEIPVDAATGDRWFHASFGNTILGMHQLLSDTGAEPAFHLRVSVDHFSNGPEGMHCSTIPVLDVLEHYDAESGQYVAVFEPHREVTSVPRTFFSDYELVVPALLRREASIQKYAKGLRR